MPVLIVHGQPGSSADFVALRRLLSPTRTVLVPDRPGWGESPEPAGGFRYNANAMLRVLDEAAVDEALVIGYSWGGGVALALAEDSPGRVAGLVLASSVGPHSLDWIDRLLLVPPIGHAVTTAGFVTARVGLSLIGAGQRFHRRNTSASHSWVQALSRSLASRHGPASFRTEQRALFDELDSINARLAEIRVATVVLAGQRDRVVPRATATALAGAIPGARLCVVADAGHPLPVFAPDEVVRAVADLQALPAAG